MALLNLLNRLMLNGPVNRAAKSKEISKILKDQGLGNNNTKRAEAAEAIIRSFTGQPQLPAQPNRPAKPTE